MGRPVKGTGRITRLALLTAVALTIFLVEAQIPALTTVPGVKLGLSNIVTMYALFVLGTRKGFAIAVLKSFFVLLTRAPMAAFMSLCGGLLSVLCMALCSRVTWLGKDYMLLSVIGALAHNLGQLLASVAYTSTVMFYYLPVLVVSGVIMGIVTGAMLRVVMPYIQRLFL